MKKYFSIGEMSKLHNISIETLRHYDRMGILKPEYINKKTGYRYYSTKSFLAIDLIKKCKAIGLSLEEIKDIKSDYTSLDSILNIIKNQKSIIDKKIIELNNIKNSIDNLENSIEEALNIGVNKLFIKYNKERKLKKYKYTKRFTKEFEIQLRKSIIEIENVYNCSDVKIAFETSYDKLIKDDELIYTNGMLELNSSIVFNEDEVVTLKEGNYLTFYFDDNFYDNKKYYENIIKYIEENNIEVIGNFYEIYEMTRVSRDGEVKSLAKIEILIK